MPLVRGVPQPLWPEHHPPQAVTRLIATTDTTKKGSSTMPTPNHDHEKTLAGMLTPSRLDAYRIWEREQTALMALSAQAAAELGVDAKKTLAIMGIDPVRYVEFQKQERQRIALAGGR